MKKSLLITYFFPPKIGGIENYLKNLCRNLPADKVAVLADPVVNSAEEDRRYQFKVIRTPLFPWRFLRPSWLPLIWRLKKIIDREKIEVLQFGHYSNLVTLGALYRFLFKKPFFVYTHGVDALIPQSSWFQRRLMRFNLKKAEWLIANSQYMKEKLIKLGVFESKILILHPSISVEKYRRVSTEDLREKYDLKGKKVILTIGRLIERKGQDNVIRALPKIIETFPQTRYLLVGDGPYKENLKALVKSLSLDDYVIFAGAVEDKIERKLPYYSLADIFVMPTREIDEGKDIESFGLVYLEAQAMACPVILGRSGGTRETIVEGETGLSVDPLKPKEITQAAIKLLSGTNLRKKMGLRGEQWVKGAFDWKNQINRLEYILNKPSVTKEQAGKPGVSIIIPAYNTAGYIEACLKSVFQQTFLDFEVILVNDGSTDDLIHRLDKYKDRIRLINQSNQGAAAARNRGVQEAKGKYFFFCDADAVLNSNLLEKMVRVLELNQFISFCYSAFYFGRRKFRALPFSSERLRKYNYIDTMSLVRKKDFVGFDPALKRFQDWDLWLRLSANGKKGLAIEESLFRKPFRKIGISKSIPIQESLAVIKKKHNL